MKNNQKLLIILLFTIILILSCIVFYQIKKHIPKKISKHGAVSLCKYIVYNKIDSSLYNNLKDIKWEIDKYTINIILIFSTDEYSTNPNYTKAYCTFDSYYKENNKLLVKKFYYKDINNNIYLYFDTIIYIN